MAYEVPDLPYDYAALGRHADLVTVMAYEFHGAWGGPGPVAPYDGVERVLASAERLAHAVRQARNPEQVA